MQRYFCSWLCLCFFFLLIIMVQPDISFREDETIVAINGLLKVKGNHIVNQNNIPISLAGNSLFWSNDGWGGERYYSSQVVSWLKTDWNTSIIRAAIGVEDPGGYLNNQKANKERVKTIVEAAIDLGIYVIIDWHSHHAEDYTDEAIVFFQEMATAYDHTKNVIYEIYNEPLDVSWTDTVKSYALKVISAIRSIDPDNLIIVGSPEWSQRVDLVAEDPITSFDNIAYSLHFYTIHHKKWLRDRASLALEKGIALFVTEWGSIGYQTVDAETDLWMSWCAENMISHCNWAVNDKKEEWSILVPGASTSGHWTDDELIKAGQLAKNIIKNWME